MQDLRFHFKQLLKFSTPIILGQLGMMLIMVGDVFIASIYSTEAVAATGLANAFFMPFLLLGIGLVIGVSPKLSVKLGRGEKIHHYLISLICYGTLIGIFLSLILDYGIFFIKFFGYEKLLVSNMLIYWDIIVWSLVFAILYEVLKEFLQAKQKVIYANVVAIVCVFLNIVINYILVFGKFGFPELGIAGLAYTSFAIRVIMFVALLFPLLKQINYFKVEWPFIKEIFDFSLPIALMTFFEVLAFSTISMIAAKFGTISAAANYIVLNIASTAFIIPLSISRASSVKIGHCKGAGDIRLVKTYTQASLILALIFTTISCTVFVIFPEQLIKLFSKDTHVILLGVELMFVVALFQLSDGLQVTLQGILRGLEQTKIPSFVVVGVFWLIGIPLGVLLAFYTVLESQGIWIGIAASLVLVSIFLAILLKKTLQNETRQLSL